MEFVIDANIVISAIISGSGKTCDLLFSDEIKLVAPEFLLEEFGKHREDILSKSGLSESEFRLALSLIASRIQFVPFSEFEKFLPKAREASPDPNDTEYFALAMKSGYPIWSNDKRLKEQNMVKVYATKDLLDLIR